MPLTYFDIPSTALDAQFDGQEGLKVACQGRPGAYSELATNKIFNAPHTIFFSTFDEVYAAVESGLVEYGVLPIENSTAGSIGEVYDLLIGGSLFIKFAYRLPVEHCLLGVPGTSKSRIREVYSHPQALTQCREYILKQGYKPIAASNTAAAAALISREQSQKHAAIASASAAVEFGLNILERGIQDHERNFTRFVVISAEKARLTSADKMSFAVSLKHEKNALYRLMRVLYEYDVNMTKIESRPIPDCPFEFMFYFDIEGCTSAPFMPNMFKALADVSAGTVKFLGCYPEN